MPNLTLQASLQVETIEECVLHHLPCETNQGCLANIEYFLPRRFDGNKSEAQLRGRDLQGLHLSLPHKVYVLERTVSHANLLTVKGSNQEIVDWEWNRNPADHSSTVDCLLNWPLIAEAIQQQVSADDIDAEDGNGDCKFEMKNPELCRDDRNESQALTHSRNLIIFLAPLSAL